MIDDNPPDWHHATCSPNIVTGVANSESVSAAVCPIAGQQGTEAATPAIDYSNEVTGTSGVPSTGDWNLDGIRSIAAATNISGKSIADQLVARGKSWKSYQEDLPASGADGVNVGDGLWSNLDKATLVNFATDFTALGLSPAPSIVGLYAAKHNPFVYFQSVQSGQDSRNSLRNVVAFDGMRGLYADLATGNVPNYSLIAPNQCNDQHGRGNAGPFCLYDSNNQGTLVGLNPAAMAQGDREVHNLVEAIHSSSVWHQGHTAIVIVWDENDYSVGIPNQAAAIVDTNYGATGVKCL